MRKPTYIPGHDITLPFECWDAVESLFRATGKELDKNQADFLADELAVADREWTGCTIYGLESETVMRLFEIIEKIKQMITQQVLRAER